MSLIAATIGDTPQGELLGMLHWLLLGNQTLNADDVRAFRRFRLALSMPNCAVFRLIRHDTKGVLSPEKCP